LHVILKFVVKDKVFEKRLTPMNTPLDLIKKKRSLFRRFSIYAVIGILIISSGFLGWFYYLPSGTNLRFMLADSLITTQHRDWAKYLIGQDELNRRLNEYTTRFDNMAIVKDNHEVQVAPITQQAAAKVEVESIETAKFKGYILYVHDPKMIRVVTTSIVGQGEQILSMVQRTGAVAGVNGGAFDDPNYDGNGFKPEGLVMSSGKILYNDKSNDAHVNAVGIDNNGLMVAGRYTPAELIKLGVQEAVTFQPKFIVNGKGLFKNEAEGWGIAPRTCMAQQKDGTIMFIVIDGRQPGYSIGGTLYDVQKILLEKGAITAANLDGGSSSVIVKDNKLLNRPSSHYGMRYLPTAFLVFDKPNEVVVNNIWKGIDMRNYNSSHKPFVK
jgi:exopolysaccharide biosynthesis protein